jgi:hypothetical protein
MEVDTPLSRAPGHRSSGYASRPTNLRVQGQQNNTVIRRRQKGGKPEERSAPFRALCLAECDSREISLLKHYRGVEGMTLKIVGTAKSHRNSGN